MAQLASAAGVTKATLYAYFAGKSALVDAVVDHWVREMSFACPMSRQLPLRQQLIDIGLQLQKLASHPPAPSLTRRIAEVEQRLSPQQMAAWRSRYAQFEHYLAGLLERHCNCERPSQAARQLMLLAIGDLCGESRDLRVADTARVESAVELILRAYPERASQP